MPMGPAMSDKITLILLSTIITLGLSSCTANTAQESQLASPQTWAENCDKWDNWDKPAPPMRIHGQTYYIGTCGIAAILISNEHGLALIDTGTNTGADVILGNIRRLGFDPKQVDLIFNSHEHFDHVGGMAKLQQATGARIVSSRIGVEVMLSGKVHADDPQFGMHDPMQPIEKKISYPLSQAPILMRKFAMPISTPGHSPGALSWHWESCEGADCQTIVYADSLSPVSSDEYRFSDNPQYVENYRAGIKRIADADCDILITPHPSSSQMVKRAATGTFKGGTSCKQYAASITKRLDERLQKEQTP